MANQSSPSEPRQAKPTAPPSLTPKISMFGTKAGFVIPKNKLAGSIVIRTKNETPTASKQDNNRHAQRKTKWGPDLALDPAVCKGRALAYQTRVEQITKKLKSGALDVDKIEGSLSTGKGLQSDGSNNSEANEQGKFELLEIERREIIGEILRLNPGYKAPDDYKPLLKETKIPLPVNGHPGHNIIGVLIGPDSNTQKRLHEETGAIIQVYGTKKLNGEKIEIRHQDINEARAAYKDLHINVSADSYDKVDAAVVLIELLLAPVSVKSAASSTSATVSSAVTPSSINPVDVQLVQSTTTSQSGLLHHQSHNAPWLSTTQIDEPSVPPPLSILNVPRNSLQPQQPVGSFSIPPCTHMNPRNPFPVPAPQHPPQFRDNSSIGPFGQPPGVLSPQSLSSSTPPPVQPLQIPHASGGWPSFSPVTPQSQRPPQASPTFMPMRSPISVSPLGSMPSKRPVALTPLSNMPTVYCSQHPPIADFTCSATLPSRPPGGAQSFPTAVHKGPSSVQALAFPAGASAQSLPVQVRPTVLAPGQMKGPPPSFSQLGPNPGMVPSSSCLSASVPASANYIQASIAAPIPPRPAAGDFTFRPVVSPAPSPDFAASSNQMGMHGSTQPGLPHAPFLRPGNQSPSQGLQRPMVGQARMHAPPPQFPGGFPMNPCAPQPPARFRATLPAVQPGGPMIPPPMLPPANWRPFPLRSPAQENPFPSANMQGGNRIYDPFAPSAGAKRADADPEYEDLMASVGVK